MKRIMLLFICFMLSFTAGFVSAKDTLRVFIENREVENKGDYIVENNKVYISQDALKRDFSFNVYYAKSENSVRLYDIKRMQLEGTVKLFEQFMDNYEPKTSDEAVKLWAKGIKERNGVFQYSVLNMPLKEKFIEAIEKRGSWITGFSSPWVESYSIAKEKLNDWTWEYKIVFNAVTSASDTYEWHATLVISKENDKWRIIEIQKDFDIM